MLKNYQPIFNNIFAFRFTVLHYTWKERCNDSKINTLTIRFIGIKILPLIPYNVGISNHISLYGFPQWANPLPYWKSERSPKRWQMKTRKRDNETTRKPTNWFRYKTIIEKETCMIDCNQRYQLNYRILIVNTNVVGFNMF